MAGQVLEDEDDLRFGDAEELFLSSLGGAFAASDLASIFASDFADSFLFPALLVSLIQGSLAVTRRMNQSFLNL